MLELSQKGSFKNLAKMLDNASNINYMAILEKYAQKGVDALSAATPKDTGLTARSWHYKVASVRGTYTISWYNSNVVDGVPIAIVLHYGHATRNGGYVQGRNYIEPAIRPIFDNFVVEAWREVSEL